MRPDLPTPGTEKEYAWESTPSKVDVKQESEPAPEVEEISPPDELTSAQTARELAGDEPVEIAEVVAGNPGSSKKKSKKDKRRRSSGTTSDEPATKRTELDHEEDQQSQPTPIIVSEDTDMPAVLLTEEPLEMTNETKPVPDTVEQGDRELDTQASAIELPSAEPTVQITATAEEPEAIELKAEPDTAEFAAQRTTDEADQTGEPPIDAPAADVSIVDAPVIDMPIVDASVDSEQTLSIPGEVEEDTFITSSRKSKKDKKKKRSSQMPDVSVPEEVLLATTAAAVAGAAAAAAFDKSNELPRDNETTEINQLPESSLDPPETEVLADQPETQTVAEEEVEPMGEDERVSSKKAKKDKKKKKRQSALTEPIEESTSGKASAESLAGPYIPDYSERTAKDNLLEEDALPPARDATTDADEFALPEKKSKKGKRKERQLTFEDLPLDNNHDLIAADAEVGDIQMVEAAQTRDDNQPPDKEPGVNATESLEHQEEPALEQQIHEELDQPMDKKVEESVHKQTEQDSPDSITDLREPVVTGPEIPAEPSIVVGDEQQSSQTKKSKKNKKKRGSTIEEVAPTLVEENTEPEVVDSSSWEMVEAEDIGEQSKEASDPQLSPEPVIVEMEEEGGFSTTSSKKSKKGKKKQALQEAIEPTIVTVSPDEATQPTMDESQELEEQLPSVAIDEVQPRSQPEVVSADLAGANEDWSSTTKKAKKGKKKKRGSTIDEVDAPKRAPLEDLEPAALNKDVIMTDEPIELASEPQTNETKEVAATFETREAANTEAQVPMEIEQPEPVVEEESTASSKKSKKDKKKKRKSTVDVIEDASSASQAPRSSQAQLAQSHGLDTNETDKSLDLTEPRDWSVDALHNEAAHQDFLAGAHAAVAEFPELPAAREQSHTEKEIVNTPQIPGQETTPSPVLEQNVVMAERGHESDGSNVSESTRERRRRRRSPPLQRDHDADDLPRSPHDRALTPPPEHDDLMDTALGVAAGLGFGAPEAEGDLDKNMTEAPIRDSGVRFEDLPVAESGPSVRDSGFVPSSAREHSWSTSRDQNSQGARRPSRPYSPTSSSEDIRSSRRSVHIESEDTPEHSARLETDLRELLETPANRQPSPVNPTSKDRSSVLFNSPAGQIAHTPRSDKKPRGEGAAIAETSIAGSFETPGDHTRRRSSEDLRPPGGSPSRRRMSNELASSLLNRAEAAEVDRSAFSPPPTHDSERAFSPAERPFSPSKTPLQTIPEGHLDRHDGALALGALAGSGLGAAAVAASARDDPTPRARSLGRSKSRTGSLRDLRASTTSPFNGPDLHPTPTRTPVNDPGIVAEGAARNMADSFEGYGSYPASPASPTRPASMRRRQSMQQIRDLESRVDQLANENRSLVEAKLLAERHLAEFELDRDKEDYATEESLKTLNEQLRQRDEEIAKLRQQIETLANSHENLRGEHENLQTEHETRYSALQEEHSQTHAQWQQSSRELEGLRSQHEELSSGMQDIVRREIDTSLAQKNAEVQRLRQDLEAARQKIRELQAKILARGAGEVIVSRDEDYFDNACQALCQHVQQWVLRFSKFSDTRVCHNTQEVRDEKVVDRFDNAILDGSDVDAYLADRIKRRDVFMSVVMTMIWEYVFARYLFGMDRDQRQKLKQLEKNLAEVGPAGAVHQWRALTLALLSKREAFRQQRESDSEAVVIEIVKTLKKFLPPPQNLESQIHESLRKVMRIAVDLSIEMRTQKAEYIMLPPLQPEYNTEGDLARKVYFNASFMNERSGETTSNDELEASRAVVRIVLFPLVVKKGDDSGNGSEEIVVCPAQVLVARPDRGKRPKSRLASGGSERGLRAVSTHSLGAMSTVSTGQGNMF